MKKLLLLVLLIAGANFEGRSQVSVTVNIGVQPDWGPSGYDYVEYYYMPDIEVYYDVPHRQYIYMDQGRWMFSANLPRHCGNYDIYNGYKVVINQPRAYLYYSDHRQRYNRYRGYNGRQVIIRNRPHYREYDNNYGYRNRNHDYDDDRYERNGRGHSHGKGHGRGRGRGHD